MSDIFYSQVDTNLQIELNARARAGKLSRTTRDLQFMLEKIANCEVIAYAGNQRDETQIVHRLGGKNVLDGEYLPSGENGWLTNRIYTLKNTKWAAQAGGFDVPGPSNSGMKPPVISIDQSVSSQDYSNSSFRIPPFITSADITIADNSMGTLNKSTINITIPNPDRDLDFMESVYGRPGRYLSVTFAHPDSAIVSQEETQGLLTTNSLPNEEIIKRLYPNTPYNELRKLNQLMFEGLLTSFEYSYNTDGTVSMTIYMTGTSNTYTDLSLIMSGSSTETNTNNVPILTESTTFYETMYNEIDSLFQKKEAERLGNTSIPPIKRAYNENIQNATEQRFLSNNERWWTFGDSLSSKHNRYITLNYLIFFINQKILSKMNNVVDVPIIQCSKEWGHYSKYLPYLCSCDPDNILFFTAETDDTFLNQTDVYGATSAGNVRKWINGNFYNKIDPDSSWTDVYSAKSFPENDANAGETRYKPSLIRINLELIKNILTEINENNSFNVHEFLRKISEKIETASGGWIRMKLVTDPIDQNVLYYLDANYINFADVTPYEVPMFANHRYGTIVRDFAFRSKLPQSVQGLMYTINQSNNVSEESIAPYLHFMYNNATITRNGNVETSSTGPSKEQLQKLANEYSILHTKYVEELIAARENFGNNPTDENKRIALSTALKKYIQYPYPEIQKSNDALAPLFPMEIEFTIDGINGLRYGDVLDFPGLPARYRNHMTFSIKTLSHTLSTSGDWTLKIITLLRPKFD